MTTQPISPGPDLAAVAPRAAPVITPTPTRHENDVFATQQMTGTLPHLPWFHAYDGSPIDPQSYSQTIGPPTWP